MAVAETALGELGIVLAGEEVKTAETYEVQSPYDGAPVAVVHRAGPDEVERAIAGAAEAFATTRQLPSWQREQVLQRISAGIAERREELARTIALEAGKPIKTARVEVDRAVVHLPDRGRGGETELRRGRPARLAARERRSGGA